MDGWMKDVTPKADPRRGRGKKKGRMEGKLPRLFEANSQPKVNFKSGGPASRPAKWAGGQDDNLLVGRDRELSSSSTRSKV